MCRYLSFILPMMVLSFLYHASHGQPGISLEELEVEGLYGVQSYAVGQHDGKVLIVGGHTDGLHKRRPFEAFDAEGYHRQLLILDPMNGKSWTRTLEELPSNISEHLRTSNMQYFQDGNTLYLTGGYGYSPTFGDFVTYGFLTSVDVPVLVEAIMEGKAIGPAFRQVFDPKFAVTGGKLGKIHDRLYLVGGHRFMGAYNPMGPDHGPGFEQDYTNAVRIFTLGDSLKVQWHEVLTDSVLFHRRDLNMLPAITADGAEELMVFSGVFQYEHDLPFRNLVSLSRSGYSQVPDFLQYFNHYHCPSVSLYDSVQDQSHFLFFGGIAQFYHDGQVLVQDNDVPFVKTIGRITRNAQGAFSEFRLPVEMPAYLGAGAEFIPKPDIPTYDNAVIKAHLLAGDTQTLGYIFGGIESSQDHVFWYDGHSQANHRLYRVVAHPKTAQNMDQPNPFACARTACEVIPDPESGIFHIQYHVNAGDAVDLRILDEKRREVYRHQQMHDTAATVRLSPTVRGLDYGTIYFFELQSPAGTETRKVIIQE